MSKWGLQLPSHPSTHTTPEKSLQKRINLFQLVIDSFCDRLLQLAFTEKEDTIPKSFRLTGGLQGIIYTNLKQKESQNRPLRIPKPNLEKQLQSYFYGIKIQNHIFVFSKFKSEVWWSVITWKSNYVNISQTFIDFSIMLHSIKSLWNIEVNLEKFKISINGKSFYKIGNILW